MRSAAGLFVGTLLMSALLGATVSRDAIAQDDLTEATSADDTMSDEARLDQAVRYYQLGERDEARRILAALVVAPTLSADLRQDARVYLAEILLVDGDKEGARGFLKQVLREDPAYTIDLFRHTPEVAGEFDYVKALLAPVGPPEEPPPPTDPVIITMPTSVWSPFGRYHFAHRRPVRGLIYFTGVTTTAVASGFMWGMVHGERRYFVDDTVAQTLDELNLRQLRWVQWSATGAFYAFWGASVIDAQIHWRKVGMKAAVKPTVGAMRGGPPTGGLRLTGTF